MQINIYKIQKIISDIDAKGEFKVPDEREALHFMVKAWNSVTVENFQHYWNKTTLLEEHEQNSTTENIKRLLNQLEINHNFSQMSAEK